MLFNKFLKKYLLFKLYIFERIFFHTFNLFKYKSFTIPTENCSSKKLFNKKVHLIGAGPSLNNDIDKINLIPSDDEIFVSNFFPLTDIWLKLKPSHLIFADSGMWNNDFVENIMINKKKKLYKILSKVSWDLNLYIPDLSENIIRKILEKNAKINFIVYPTRSSYQNNIKIRSTLISKRIVPPKICNAILVAIWISIMSKSKSLFLYGLDSAQFKNIDTDQKTNEVLVSGPVHFYDGDNSHEKKKKTKLLYQRFQQIYIMFRDFHVISIVAKLNGVDITNLSSYSIIDNFKRKII